MAGTVWIVFTYYILFNLQKKRHYKVGIMPFGNTKLMIVQDYPSVKR